MTTINQYYPESVTHPSAILQEVLEEKQMGAKEFAIKTGKPEKTISMVLNGKSAITPDMAIRFEQVLRIPSHFWNEAQKNYDEYKARVKYQSSIDEAVSWAKEFPYAKMASLGWVLPTRNAKEKVIQLFNFFGIATRKGFEDYYYHQRTQVAFRVSLLNQEYAPAIAAWLRRGELQAEHLRVSSYTESALKNTIPELKEIMAAQPNGFFDKIQKICAGAGVKVVYTPCLPNAPIHGSTRWVNDIPLIQLSGRYKRNDIFWFTFFHELGHILLHGKKYISIENLEVEGENEAYEKEANEFAAEIILSQKEQDILLSQPSFPDEDILAFARKFGTHPACIVGRLQHLGILRPGAGNHFYVPIHFE